MRSIRHSLRRRLSAGILAAAVFLIPAATHAADFSMNFGFAPRLDLTYTTFLGGTIDYNDAWYSSLMLEYGTELTDETSTADGVNTTLTADADTFSTDLDLIGFNVLQGNWDLGLALSGEYILLNAAEESQNTTESGDNFVGLDSDTLVITNDRRLQILLPTADVKLRGSDGPVYLEFGGEYAPVIFVDIAQTLATDPVFPGATDDGPITSVGLFQSEQSFSVSGAFRVISDVFSPSVAAEFTQLPITYDAATLSGVTSLQTTIRELSVDANFGFALLNVMGFFPTLQVTYDRSWTQIAGQEDVTMEDQWLFYAGASRLP